MLGATVWVGGQLALAFVVPVVRMAAGRDVVREVARRFQLVAWPAYALLVGTGIWNLFAGHVGNADSDYLASLFVKLLFVGVSGACALGHTMIASRKPALGGALAGLSLLSALGALFVGVQLAVDSGRATQQRRAPTSPGATARGAAQ